MILAPTHFIPLERLTAGIFKGGHYTQNPGQSVIRLAKPVADHGLMCVECKDAYGQPTVEIKAHVGKC